eukprot:6182348-Pleurochrysis_carterae.AAC.4
MNNWRARCGRAASAAKALSSHRLPRFAAPCVTAGTRPSPTANSCARGPKISFTRIQRAIFVRPLPTEACVGGKSASSNIIPSRLNRRMISASLISVSSPTCLLAAVTAAASTCCCATAPARAERRDSTLYRPLQSTSCHDNEFMPRQLHIEVHQS